ncbi:DUF5681 domain-containing protein [Caenibius sp. WL]|uniref:DUF5681 domain-containing protein n=1 Tax=Caenibius sp. WL TaxID=2872646 RepID=UPI001C998A18|nr:DUF5681 domain-containing protein [Caenibius sp. WL]QZP07729.1 DUF5681 domain-containing protein [Caenibius sp. WL]
MTRGNASNGGGGQPSKWGRGKTDPDTWWEKGGPSPNPKGRPRGSKNQKTLYQEAFGAKIVVNIDGAEKEMTKRELGYHQVATKSAAGDIKAFQIQRELDEKYEPVEVAPPTPEESAADYKTFKAHLELLRTFRVFEKEEADEFAAQRNDDDNNDDEEEDYDDEDSDGEDADDDNG